MSEVPGTENDVLCRLEGRVGRITLNRPQALHALTTDMCRRMIAALLDWRDDPGVELVLIDHAGERGFCAGGDIRMLADSGAGDGEKARKFFFTEYRLSHLLFHYRKPTMAIMDGVTMGGGVGLALPCDRRVVTERTTFAMPETGIGLFPDVGGGWHLPRMPDRIGIWLALTGARIKAADCELVGIGTDYVPSVRIPRLKDAVVQMPQASGCLVEAFRGEAGEAPLAATRQIIARAFAADSVEGVIAALEADASEWAGAQLAALRAKSPQTLKVAARQLRLGQAQTFTENMAMEYRIASRVVHRHDFLEGVRAILIAKDNKPAWKPPSLDEIDEALLDAIFAPLPTAREWFPLDQAVPCRA